MYIYRTCDRDKYKKLLDIFTLTTFEQFDYFFRKTHFDKMFLYDCCKRVFSHIDHINDELNKEIFLADNSYRIFLSPYALGRYNYNSYKAQQITFDTLARPLPQFLTEFVDKDYDNRMHIYKLLLKKFGILFTNPAELFRRLGIRYNFVDRYLLNLKPLNMQKMVFYQINDLINLSYQNEYSIKINDYEYEKIISNNLISEPYPLHYGYRIENIYWYRAENGGIHFGVIYFSNITKSSYKLPITMWVENAPRSPERKTSTDILGFTGRLDLLHPYPPYHIFNIDKIALLNNLDLIVICEDEQTVFDMESKVINKDLVFSTWSGGYDATVEDTDWKFLTGKPTAILISKTFNPKIVFHVYNRIKKAHTNFRGFIEKDSLFGFNPLPKIQLNNINYISIDEYVNLIYKEQGIILDEKYIDKSISAMKLLDTDLPPAPFIINNLIRLGEQVMIFGPRGVSKSYFAYLLAILIATGTNTCNEELIINQPQHVLIIDGEMEISLIKRRISSIANGLGITNIYNLSILSSSEQKEIFDFSNDSQLEKYSSSISKSNVIILDSVAFTFPEAMGSSTEASKKLNSFLLKNRNSKITTIVIDHSSTKSNSKSLDSFGTSTKSFALDLILSLSEKNNTVNVDITKGRSITKSGTLLKYKLDSVEYPDSPLNSIKFNFIESNKNRKFNFTKSQKENFILNIIKESSGITGSEIHKKLINLGVQISKTSVHNYLNDLIDHKKVQKIPHKNGYYIN